jgi:quinol monooxygenase YgiN
MTRRPSRSLTSIPKPSNLLPRIPPPHNPNANPEREGQKEGVNSGPPTIAFGYVVGGWLTRPGESKRTKDQIILFAKYTTHPGKRSEFTKVLYDGMGDIDTHEPGTLSILLIEDDQDADITYVMERFKDQAAIEAHMNGPGAAKVGPLLKGLVTGRVGGKFREVAGFVSKDE